MIKSYPKPTLKLIRNKWVVVVNIPSSIRHLFGNGKGTTSNVRKSTGTSDKQEADSRLMGLANLIYNEFDDKQKKHADQDNLETEGFAISVIYDIAKEFNYNRGVVPTLDPNTDYEALLNMKDTFDSYVKMWKDQLYENYQDKDLTKIIELAEKGKDLSEEEKKVLVDLDNLIEEKSIGRFTPKQEAMMAQYQVQIVQSFYQDLLTEAAQLQGRSPPIFKDLKSTIQVVKLGNKILPKRIAPEGIPFERSRKTVAKGSLKMSDLTELYFKEVRRDYEKIDTQRKLIRGVNRFLELMGDLPIQEINQSKAYTFIDKQLELNPTASNKSLKDYHWSMVSFLTYCIKKDHVSYNTFKGAELNKYGKVTKNYLPYSSEELFTIFNYAWEPQERLLLSILVTTGMRLTEAASLTWERYNDTEFQGIRYFSLIDTNNEKVYVKNEGSNRNVPLHPDLILPPKGSGRLFNYTIDQDGLASSSAGDAINPTLNQLVSHQRKSAHSFRRTLKILLRDADVSKEVNDVYTGHGSGDTSGKNYGGVSEVKRYNEISRVRHPWLKK